MTGEASTELPTSAAGGPGAGAGAERPDPHLIVLFGAGGDLAARKLIPGFFHLQNAGLLPQQWRLVGTAEQDYDDDGFRDHAREAIEQFGRSGVAEGDLRELQQRLSYVPVSAGAGPWGEGRGDGAPGDRRRLPHAPLPGGAAARAFGAITETLGGLGLTGPEARVIWKSHSVTTTRRRTL